MEETDTHNTEDVYPDYALCSREVLLRAKSEPFVASFATVIYLANAQRLMSPAWHEQDNSEMTSIKAFLTQTLYRARPCDHYIVYIWLIYLSESTIIPSSNHLTLPYRIQRALIIDLLLSLLEEEIAHETA